jgi:hypothetical protein
MSLIDEVSKIIEKSENEEIAYEIILPSVKSMAKTISSMANTNGGYLIIGISKEHGFKGLSSDFNSNSITKRALKQLVPVPKVSFESVVIEGKPLFVVKVDKSTENILLEDKKHIRIGSKIQEDKTTTHQKKISKKEYAKTYVIIISIENYFHDIKQVKYANNDAELFKTMLIDYMNVEEEDILTFINEDAIKSNLKYNLQGLFHELTEEDRLIFYYVGHGFHDGTTNYLSTYDLHHLDITGTAISLREVLLDPFSKSKCKSALVFIDACATNIQDENSRNILSNIDYYDLFEIENNQNLYSATFLSCQGGESSYSCDDLKHGVWTYHLNKAITGKEPSLITNNKFISDRSLVDYLSRNVYKYTKDNLGYEQNPKAILDADSEFVLVEIDEE